VGLGKGNGAVEPLDGFTVLLVLEYDTFAVNGSSTSGSTDTGRLHERRASLAT
jgi:hypothetical protein